MRIRALIAVLSLAACGQVGRPTAEPGPAERTARAGVPVEFDGSASRGSISKYSWDFGDNSALVEEKTTTHTYAANGQYSATLKVTGPGGAHSATVLVNVGAGCSPTVVLEVKTGNPQPNMPIIFGSDGSMGCMGAAITNYEWDFGDGTMDSGANKSTVAHTYSTMNTYNVKLKITDADGNSVTATRMLGVGVMVTCGKPTVTCPSMVSGEMGRPVALSANGTDSTCSKALTYAWTFSDGTTGVGQNVMKTFNDAMTYTAIVTGSTVETTPRVSDPCTTSVIISAPRNYTGSWLVSPSNGNNMAGCSQFMVPFPATTLGILHQGNMLTVTPSGGAYPGSPALTGTEEPTMPGTWVVRSNTPNENPGGSNCSLSIATSHTLRLTFTSATVVTGSWTKIYDATASCGTASCGPCSCLAGGATNGAYNGIKM